MGIVWVLWLICLKGWGIGDLLMHLSSLKQKGGWAVIC